MAVLFYRCRVDARILADNTEELEQNFGPFAAFGGGDENGTSLSMYLLKSILHNMGVVIVGLGIAFLCTMIDASLGVSGFHAVVAIAWGGLLLIAEFFLRVWATFHFYQHRMKVIPLSPQQALLTSGPYRFSRNPLRFSVCLVRRRCAKGGIIPRDEVLLDRPARCSGINLLYPSHRTLTYRAISPWLLSALNQTWIEHARSSVLCQERSFHLDRASRPRWLQARTWPPRIW
jgi:Phospholipid methyltransferase